MTVFLYQNEALIRLGIFIGGFLLLSSWEWFTPKRALTQVKIKRWFNNIGLIVCGTLLTRLLLPVAAIGVAYYVNQQQWGLANHVSWPFWLKVTFSFIVLDLIIYLQHTSFHVLPSLWRIHRVHHSDLDFDVTTGLRFHPLEIFISILIKFVAITALGAPVLSVIIFEAALNFMSMFTHTNIRLNKKLEQVMRWFIVTPDMHRVHHSIEENETNSNFSFNFSIWDRIFGTYVAQPAAGHQNMIIGLEQFNKERWQNLRCLLGMPFVTGIHGYAINYRDTKNADELILAREIALHSQQKEKLATELASYMQAINKHALVSVTDIDGKIIQVNEKLCEVSQYSKEELLGKDHNLLNSGTHSAEFFEELWNTIKSGASWQGEICNRAKDGTLYWVDSTIVPSRDLEGNIERYISVRIDITAHKAHELELEKTNQELADANHNLETISRTDGLTKIANRRYFDETLLNEISKLSRINASISLLLCDIDFFKKYNDLYGHPAGDVCLYQVAQAISASFSRAGDLVARYGGEEFAIILTAVNKETALKLAQQACNNVANLKIEHNDSSVSEFVTISIGVATLKTDKNTTPLMIIEKADEALYMAKENGRNNVHSFD